MKPLKKSKIKFICALSLDQPWGHMIVQNKMNVESRRWTTKRRGTIAIHATAKKSKHEFEWIKENFKVNLSLENVAFGSVIGFANLVDVIDEKKVTSKTRKWFIGPFGFVLENIVVLPTPVPAKGNRKFWHLKGRPLMHCLDQLSSAEIKKFRKFV